VCNFFANTFASLYAGAFFQFTFGILGTLYLFIFTRSLMFGAVTFKLTYCHPSLFLILNQLFFYLVYSSVLIACLLVAVCRVLGLLFVKILYVLCNLVAFIFLFSWW